MSRSELVEFAVHLADIAAAEILPHFRTDLGIENKATQGRYDPVTIADRDAESAMRREIRRIYPQHGIQGEEHGLERGTSEYTWLIDPIDGTRSFVLGQLHWGTLIALADDSRPLIGVMRQPYTGETFVGHAGGTELRRLEAVTRLSARRSTRLEDACVCATDPTMFESPQRRVAFERLVQRARSMRYGGDCYTPCLVAAGWADLVVEAGLKPWDVAALVPIVEGAGGVITDWSGNRPASDDMVIASNPALHAQVIEALAWSRN
jgi:histidinol phosphatase-like enzyme (inositol monophosphatase family)